jgi:sarcosine oxidase
MDRARSTARAVLTLGAVDRYDVIVIGLGAMGSATAAALARRGAGVLGIEQFGAVHDRGSSHGASRIVRMAYFEHPDYVPLLRRAYAGWARLEAATGRSLITWCGALMIGRPDGDVVAGTLASARRWGLPHELLDGAAMAEAFPQFVLGADEVAVVERNAGVVHPEDAVRSQLDDAATQGAELRFESVVGGWDIGAGGVVVDAGGARVSARRLVVTAGPWAPRLLAHRFPLVPVRTVTCHYAPPDAGAFTVERFPAFVWELDAGDSLYGMAEPATNRCKFGFHHRRTTTDPDELDRAVSPAETAAMDDRLAGRIPGVAGRCVATTVCMYTMTPDEHFVIGHLPGTDGAVAVAAGFSGHGFKFAPVVGEILADLALDGGTDAPIALFDPTRFD